MFEAPKALFSSADKGGTGWIMNTQSFYTRQMLLQYGRQLVAARRVARYEQLVGRTGAGPQDAAAQRRAMVERITREIMENLIFSGSDNPVVREVHDALARETGETHVFRYPPGSLEVQVFRVMPDGTEEELRPEDKRTLMGRLWDVTLRTVDATML